MQLHGEGDPICFHVVAPVRVHRRSSQRRGIARSALPVAMSKLAHDASDEVPLASSSLASVDRTSPIVIRRQTYTPARPDVKTTETSGSRDAPLSAWRRSLASALALTEGRDPPPKRSTTVLSRLTQAGGGLGSQAAGPKPARQRTTAPCASGSRARRTPEPDCQVGCDRCQRGLAHESSTRRRSGGRTPRKRLGLRRRRRWSRLTARLVRRGRTRRCRSGWRQRWSATTSSRPGRWGWASEPRSRRWRTRPSSTRCSRRRRSHRSPSNSI
jgi:hypothetical protein